MNSKPMPGDAVHYIGDDVRRVLLCGEELEERYKPLNSWGRIGIINGVLGEPRDEFLVTFNPYGGAGFRGGLHGKKDEGTVSVSGGPVPLLTVLDLEYTGETLRLRFWCWRCLPEANGGEDYTREVPVWNWAGPKES